MFFVLFKIFRFGYKETKKHRAKKQPQYQQPYPPQPSYYTDSNGQSIPYYPQPPPDASYAGMPPPAATMDPDSTKTQSTRSKPKTYAELLLQILQFAFALAVIGLYGQEHPSPAKWVYAETVGCLACATAFVYLVLGWWWRKRGRLAVAERAGFHLPLFAWEVVLIVLWLVVFGIFGEMYIGVYYVGGTGAGKNGAGTGTEPVDSGAQEKVTKMRRAVWVDLVNLLFWVASAAWRGFRWWKSRGSAPNATTSSFGEDGEELQQSEKNVV